MKEKEMVIDLSKVCTKEGLHKCLKETLGFPDYYGMNWDAFWDAITGLVELPEKLIFAGWSALEERIPREAGILKQILEDYREQYPEGTFEVSYGNGMHFGAVLTADMANGPGIRLSLFVSGCTNCCKGCFQPETWDFCYGKPYTSEVEDYLIQELSQSYYRGITILGGEPFELSNQETLVKLIRRLKRECPDKDIWMYTGFVYDRDLVPGGCRYGEYTDEILDGIQALVDGPFVEDKKSLRLRFRGSENQRIIDMVATRKAHEVVLSELNN